MNREQIEALIELAQEEVEKAIEAGNPPFGAVLTDSQGNVIVTAHNTQNSSNDPTAHAEINLLREAAKVLGRLTFEGYLLFCNAESCSMCMSACIKAKIRHFYYGAPHEPHMDPSLSAAEVAEKSKEKIHLYPGYREASCIEQIKRGRKRLEEH